MRIPRIYHPELLNIGTELTLSYEAAGHLIRVLRMKEGQAIVLFDGSGYEFPSIINSINSKKVQVQIIDKIDRNSESPLNLHLGQVMSRGDKMEFTIQKSTELGVNTITPLISERCGVKYDVKRLEKKREQWQKIAISACEQSGRNKIPHINPVMSLEEWCRDNENALKLNLHPKAQISIGQLTSVDGLTCLLIGPEGGLSDTEIALTEQLNFKQVLLGPRVLRTETAALSAITALQVHFGDLR